MQQMFVFIIFTMGKYYSLFLHDEKEKRDIPLLIFYVCSYSFFLFVCPKTEKGY